MKRFIITLLILLNTITTVEAKVIRYHWGTGSNEYIYDIDIPEEVYNQYKSSDRSYTAYTFYEYINEPTNKWVCEDIARQIKEYNGTKYDIIKFVQTIPYETDLVSTGHSDWPKYPIETLYDKCGDCEDSTILLAGILRAFGEDVIFIELDGHIVLGINADDVCGTNIIYNNKYYFTIETTNDGWKIGELSNKYTTGTAIPIKEE